MWNISRDNTGNSWML